MLSQSVRNYLGFEVSVHSTLLSGLFSWCWRLPSTSASQTSNFWASSHSSIFLPDFCYLSPKLTEESEDSWDSHSSSLLCHLFASPPFGFLYLSHWLYLVAFSFFVEVEDCWNPLVWHAYTLVFWSSEFGVWWSWAHWSKWFPFLCGRLIYLYEQA